jgi:hypothetical protein
MPQQPQYCQPNPGRGAVIKIQPRPLTVQPARRKSAAGIFRAVQRPVASALATKILADSSVNLAQIRRQDVQFSAIFGNGAAGNDNSLFLQHLDDFLIR